MNRFVREIYHVSRKILPPSLANLITNEVAVRGLQKSLPYWERKEREGKDRPLVRIGFVGAGRHAQHHLKVLSSLDKVEILSICTRGSPRVYEVAKKYNILRVFTEIDQFVSQEDVDAFVVVVSIPETKAVTLKCLGGGKPVLLEKPAGLSSADTAELVKQAERHKTFGMVAMNRRFYSVVEHGLAALAGCGPLRGVILEIPEAISDRRQSMKQPEQVYDHWMFANSVHGIDLLHYILGNVVSVRSLARPHREAHNAAASFAAILEGEGNTVGSVIALWDTLPKWHLKVIAEQGWLEFSPLEQGWFVNRNGDRITLKPDSIDIEFRMGVYAQDLHFVEAVRAGKKPALPACLLPDAYKTNLLIEQIMGNRVT